MTEFAAQIGLQSRQIIESPDAIAASRLEECRQAARVWLIDFLRRIDECVGAPSLSAANQTDEAWLQLVPILRDVFAAEMVNRVWGAVLTARSQRTGDDHCRETARQILVLQLQVRQRALQLLVDGFTAQASHVAAIDRWRRKAERWTDLLLGEMVLRDDVPEFACEPRRSREFGVDYFQNQTHAAQLCTWQLIAAGMRTAFATNDSAVSPVGAVAEDLFRAILACLPEDAFRPDGPSYALRTIRLHRSQSGIDQAPGAATAQRLRRLVPPERKPAPGAGHVINFSQLRRQHK